MTQAALIRGVRALLKSAALLGKPDEITLRHSLNEGWFSDTLEWLLDPRGDHGLGVRFLREFLNSIARERCEKASGYSRRATHLRWSTTPGPGQRATILKLGNAASFREFYLSRGSRTSKVGDRFCDVVVLDLDSDDGLVLVIENKLFGANHTGQLRDQLFGVEEKYSRATIREYVYLTLLGDKPRSTSKTERDILDRWVSLGWLTHVLEAIQKVEPAPMGRLKELVVLLQWLKSLKKLSEEHSDTVQTLVATILTGSADCFLAELNRLCCQGNWECKTSASKKHRLVHTSAPSRHLTLKLLANCSITVQSKKKSRAQCDKLLLPFGAPARQVYNLMHITARDLYWIHFGKPKAFLANRRRRKILSDEEKRFAPVLNFISSHRFEIQALLGVSRCTR